MKKVIKIGFPIVCIAVIGGTFILLNNTTGKIIRNKLDEDDSVSNTVQTSNEIASENIVTSENIVRKRSCN